MPEIDVIQTSHIRKYRASLAMKPQQMDSRLINTVTTESNVGSGIYFFDRVGLIEGQEVVDRFGDTPHNELEYGRRGLVVRTYDSGRIIDNDEDTLRAAIDPSSPIMKALRAWGYRTMDDVILESIFAPVLVQDENENISTVNFDTSTKQVAATVQAGAGSSACGLNMAKIKRGKRILMENEIPEGTEISCAVSPAQIESLMNDPEVTDADYNALRPLMTGTLVQHYGVNFVPTNRLTKTGSNERVPLYIREAIHWGWGDGGGLTGKILLRNDKKGKPHLYVKFNGGCAREHDEGVVELVCTTSGQPTAA